jgi:hypothetical protein
VTDGVVSEMVIDSPRWREMAVVNVQEDDTAEDADLGCGVLNARLMAAAPDLLAACEACVHAFEEMGDGTITPDERIVLAQAHAAIAKARGEP